MNSIVQIKILLSFLLVCLLTSTFAQNKEQQTMRSFVPKSQAYDIYYPLDYKLIEGDNGIVTITDTLSGLNITLSTYNLQKKIKDIDIIIQLNSFINETYNKKINQEDWNSYKTKFDVLVELKTSFDDSNWIWYGINNKKSLVILSINKKTEINQEEINLMMYMIDNMIINE